jgi:S1-C subfamily serine protease
VFPLYSLLLILPLLETPEFSEAVQRRTLAATVRLVDREGEREASGVVVAIREQVAYILTAQHAVAKNGKFEVRFFTEKSYPKPAFSREANRVVMENATCDLALIQVDLKGIDTLPEVIPIRLDPVKEKEFLALSSGAAANTAPTLEKMHVRGRKLVKRKDGGTAFFWQTDEAPLEGRSGGPLVDREGKLIGITSGEQDRLGYFSHLDEIRSWLKKTDDGKFRWLVESK